jgi:hypothetical protein
MDSWWNSVIECTMRRCIWALVLDSISQHMDATTLRDDQQLTEPEFLVPL